MVRMQWPEGEGAINSLFSREICDLGVLKPDPSGWGIYTYEYFQGRCECAGIRDGGYGVLPGAVVISVYSFY